MAPFRSLLRRCSVVPAFKWKSLANHPMCDKALIISLITTAMFHSVYFRLLFDLPAFYVNNGFNQDFDHWNTKLPFLQNTWGCVHLIFISNYCAFMLETEDTRMLPDGILPSTEPTSSKNNCIHDDVIKWKHFPRYWPFVRGIHGSRHKGQWRGAVIFFLCVWINGWENINETGDLRRYRAQYDVIVKQYKWVICHYSSMP